MYFKKLAPLFVTIVESSEPLKNAIDNSLFASLLPSSIFSLLEYVELTKVVYFSIFFCLNTLSLSLVSFLESFVLANLFIDYIATKEDKEKILKEDFIENKKWLIMNCTIKEYLEEAWNGGTYRDEPTEEVIREFMKYNELEDFNLAKKYFNKSCCECDKRIKDKGVLAMNMKIHGRNINRFYCKKCFKQLHNLSEDDWNCRLESFKQSGCALF